MLKDGQRVQPARLNAMHQLPRLPLRGNQIEPPLRHMRMLVQPEDAVRNRVPMIDGQEQLQQSFNIQYLENHHSRSPHWPQAPDIAQVAKHLEMASVY
jgi:hypothetical protein